MTFLDIFNNLKLATIPMIASGAPQTESVVSAQASTSQAPKKIKDKQKVTKAQKLQPPTNGTIPMSIKPSETANDHAVNAVTITTPVVSPKALHPQDVIESAVLDADTPQTEKKKKKRSKVKEADATRISETESIVPSIPTEAPATPSAGVSVKKATKPRPKNTDAVAARDAADQTTQVMPTTSIVPKQAEIEQMSPAQPKAQAQVAAPVAKVVEPAPIIAQAPIPSATLYQSVESVITAAEQVTPKPKKQKPTKRAQLATPANSNVETPQLSAEPPVTNTPVPASASSAEADATASAEARIDQPATVPAQAAPQESPQKKPRKPRQPKVKPAEVSPHGPTTPVLCSEDPPNRMTEAVATATQLALSSSVMTPGSAAAVQSVSEFHMRVFMLVANFLSQFSNLIDATNPSVLDGTTGTSHVAWDQPPLRNMLAVYQSVLGTASATMPIASATMPVASATMPVTSATMPATIARPESDSQPTMAMSPKAVVEATALEATAKHEEAQVETPTPSPPTSKTPNRKRKHWTDDENEKVQVR